METVIDVNFEELKNMYRQVKKEHDKKVARRNTKVDNAISEDDVLDKHFKSLIDLLNKILTELSKDHELHIRVLCMKTALMYEQAKVMMAMEDLVNSRIMLESALELLAKHSTHKQVVFLYMRIVNHLAYLISKNGNYEDSKRLLESILENKDEFENDIQIYSTDELFSNKEIDQSQANNKLNKLIANNLQMLGWIYGRLGKPEVHAAKQHMSLAKQLEAGDCDPINWACRCFRLAALYLSICNWKAARYHLLAAGTILDILEREMVSHPQLARAQADLARGWVNYGLHLFNSSSSKFLDRKYPGTFNENGCPAVDEDTKSNEVVEEEEEISPFPGIKVGTENVPVRPVSNTEEARNLFLHTHTWLKRARLFYTLRDFPIAYVNAVLDLSELYRFLSIYEPDLDSQYNVQKRRVDALETLSAVLREVRPRCYIAVSVELLRELSEIQIEMLGINLRRLHMTENEHEEDNIKRKVSAICSIHTKLEGVGDMLGRSNLEVSDTLRKNSHSIRTEEVDENSMLENIDESAELQDKSSRVPLSLVSD